MAREQLRESVATEQHFAEVNSAIAAARSLRPSPRDHFADSADCAQHAAYDQFVEPDDTLESYVGAAHADATYSDTSYEDGPRIESRFDNSPHELAGQPAASDDESYFFDGAPAPAEQTFYDDPPRPRAANGVVYAMVLIGCGILGTAGAYGYRTYYSGTRQTDAPIITADKTPNKVVPASTGGDGQSGKSADRVGGGSERVVARQEEPVMLPDPSKPRVALAAPFPVAPGQPDTSPSSNAAAVQAPAVAPPAVSSPSPVAAVPGETKRVHTIAIHPADGGDPLARPMGPPNPPLSIATASPQAASPHQAAKQASASTRNGGPLSLDPQGQTGAAASSYQAVPQDHPKPSAGKTQLASASSSPASAPASVGGYMVQISSQRSEADAQASIRSLQSKYPNQLGEREAIVRRADLGQKGVYYRAMIGPFGNAGEADQFCSNLKAAGGQCIVQRN